MELTFYTLDEVLAKADKSSDFIWCLKGTDLQNVPAGVIESYSNWYGLWLDSGLTDAEVKAECINQVVSWIAYVQKKALYWLEYIKRQKAFTGKQESTSKFLDTPETETDYSGDTHVTNITKSTTEQDNALGLETLKPVAEMLVEQFRKTWLLPKEAI